MRRFEVAVLRMATSWEGGPFIPDDRIRYWLPDEAEELLRPILARYSQSPLFYFDKINFGQPPAPWAFVCLDREYPLAGHIATVRPPDAGIFFVPYTRPPPEPLPEDFIPAVGVLVLDSKRGLERAAAASPLFSAAWKALLSCPADRCWLVLLAPLPEEWVATAAQGNDEQWLASQRRQSTAE